MAGYTNTTSLNVGSEYTDDEREFMTAMDRYMSDNHRRFPSWHEVLSVLLSIGYRKVEEAGPIPTHQRGHR